MIRAPEPRHGLVRQQRLDQTKPRLKDDPRNLRILYFEIEKGRWRPVPCRVPELVGRYPTLWFYNYSSKLARLTCASTPFREADHGNSILVKPGAERKAPIVFYLFTERHRAERKANMARLAEQAFSETTAGDCVVIGRDVDRWDIGFDTLLLARRDCSASLVTGNPAS